MIEYLIKEYFTSSIHCHFIIYFTTDFFTNFLWPIATQKTHLLQKKVGIPPVLVLYYLHYDQIQKGTNMKSILTIAVLLMLCGCVNIDYTGRKFPAQAQVQYVESLDEIQLDEYTLIGRFSVTSRMSVHPYDVEEEVLARAKEYGGDILLLTGVETIRNGVYTPNEQEFGTPDRRRNPAEEARFGRRQPLTSNATSRELRSFEYLLYKKTSEVNRLLGY